MQTVTFYFNADDNTPFRPERDFTLRAVLLNLAARTGTTHSTHLYLYRGARSLVLPAQYAVPQIGGVLAAVSLTAGTNAPGWAGGYFPVNAPIEAFERLTVVCYTSTGSAVLEATATLYLEER